MSSTLRESGLPLAFTCFASVSGSLRLCWSVSSMSACCPDLESKAACLFVPQLTRNLSLVAVTMRVEELNRMCWQQVVICSCLNRATCVYSHS
jgi:hypothetical protein